MRGKVCPVVELGACARITPAHAGHFLLLIRHDSFYAVPKFFYRLALFNQFQNRPEKCFMFVETHTLTSFYFCIFPFFPVLLQESSHDLARLVAGCGAPLHMRGKELSGS